MKTKLFILSILMLVLTACEKEHPNYDWKDISLKNDIDLTSIYMLDDETGFVGGNSGVKIEEIITHMGDIPSPYGDTLIYSPNNENSYVEYKYDVDQDIEPILYKTTDGGSSWQSITTPFKIGIKDIQFFNENTGYLVSKGEGVYKTIDGGREWNKILGNRIHVYYGQGFNDPFDAVCFINENTGFVYGTTSSNVVLSTKNGGLTWDCVSIAYTGKTSEKYPEIFSSVSEIAFPNSKDTGYILSGKILYKTVNQGATWVKVYESDYRFNPVFYNSSTVFLPEQHVYTQNGGVTWNKTPLFHFGEDMVTPNLNEFYYLNNGEIRRTISGQQEWYDMSKENDSWVHELTFPSENTGYAIGNESLILKYTKRQFE